MADPGTDALVFRIDSDLCSGHGRCYGLAPESFDADDSGYGVVTGRRENDRDDADIARIVGCCPEQALSIHSNSEQVSSR